jgi:uncharacterized protein (DUF2062 family)
MPKKFLKRFIAKHAGLKSHPSLKMFGDSLHHPNLWHITRHSVIKAVTIGFFVSFLPLPGHMLMAACLALLLHANVILAMVLVWASNPLTMGPMYYLGYRVGIALLGHPEKPFHFELTWHWFVTEFEVIAAPLFLGCILCGVVFALLGNIAVRILWRCSVSMAFNKRKKHRLSTSNKSRA